MSEQIAPKGQWPYTVAIGDMCFVALGQIVNRRLFVAGPDWGNGITMWSGVFSLSINSPLQTPSLAAAARADWGGITAEQLAESLKNDALGLNNPEGKSVNGIFRSEINPLGGLKRLLFYFPAMGRELVESILSQPFVPTALPKAEGSSLPRELTSHEALRVLEFLGDFRWDGLDARVFTLYQKAVAEEQKAMAALPPGRRLGWSDVPLACAKRLIHQNHDDEFRAFFTAALERANRDYPIAAQKITDDSNKELSIFEKMPANFPKEKLDRQQKDLVIQMMTSVLKQPIEARAAFLKELGPASR